MQFIQTQRLNFLQILFQRLTRRVKISCQVEAFGNPPSFFQSGGGGGFACTNLGYSRPCQALEGVAGRRDLCSRWDLASAGQDRDNDFAQRCVLVTRDAVPPQPATAAGRDSPGAGCSLSIISHSDFISGGRVSAKGQLVQLESDATGHAPSHQTCSRHLVLRVRQKSPCPMPASIQPCGFPQQSS